MFVMVWTFIKKRFSFNQRCETTLPLSKSVSSSFRPTSTLYSATRSSSVVSSQLYVSGRSIYNKLIRAREANCSCNCEKYRLAFAKAVKSKSMSTVIEGNVSELLSSGYGSDKWRLMWFISSFSCLMCFATGSPLEVASFTRSCMSDHVTWRFVQKKIIWSKYI